MLDWTLLLVKTSLVLVAGFAVTALLARATASTRHAVWGLALVGVLVLPAISWMLPTFDVEVLPTERIAAEPLDRPDPTGAAVAEVPPVKRAVPATPRTRPASRSGAFGLTSIPAPIWLLSAYGLGIALLATRLGWGLHRIRRVTVASSSLDGVDDWRELIALARRESRREACEVRAADVPVPMTWGLFRPVIFVPRAAASWPAHHRRQALLHEAAHVRRGDWAYQLVGRIACAFYWFNPLIWIACRRLTLEAERACDDRVLLAGAPADDYAEQLLTLARREHLVAAAVPMARASQLSIRLRSILSATARRSHMSRRSHLTLALVAVLLLAGLGSVSPVRAREKTWIPPSRTTLTPLMDAVARGDAGDVRRLLDAGARPEEASAGSATPLILAAAVGDVDIVRALIDSGANVNQAYRGDRDRRLMRSPLATAARWGHLGVVRTLLDAGAEVDLAPSGDATALMEAVGEGHQEIAELLVDRGADVNRVIRGDGTALIAAARGGNAEGIDLLLSEGADPNTGVRGDGDALTNAARRGNADAVARLLQAGANPNSWISGDEGPLYHALHTGDVEVAEMLIDAGADVNARWPGDGSPLIVAARSGDVELVRMMLDEGADVDRGVRGDGNPLIMAARGGHLDVVQLLVERGATVDRVVPGDENALIQAAENGRYDVAAYLIDRGADVNRRVRANGETRTPLGQAQRRGHDDLVELLRSHGARN